MPRTFDPKMNYPVPHYTRPKNVRDSNLEELCYVDLHHVTCKPFFRYNLKSEQEDEVAGQRASAKAALVNPPKATLPFPIFSPSPVCCGRGPVANRIFCPQEYPSKLLDLRVKFECKRITSYNPGSSKSHFITKLNRNNKIPTVLQGLQHILCRYSSVEKYPSRELSFAGGNLNTLPFESKELVLHSTPEHDGTLCLTQLNSRVPHREYPAEIDAKIRLEDGGLVFQICVARESPAGFCPPGPLFVTRQLETSTLWTVCRGDDDQLLVSRLQHLTDDSLVRCVDVSPYIRTEWCELRSDSLTISRHSECTYRRNFQSDDYWRCQWANHPQTLILAGDKSVELLDLRIPTSSQTSTLLSLKCDRFLNSYNILGSENISCLAPTAESAGYSVATDRSFAIADLRMSSRLLHKVAHLMDKPPQLAASVVAPTRGPPGDPAQWTLLTSASGASSATLVHRWDSVRLASSPVQGLSVRIAVPLHEPVRRADLSDTLEKLQQRGYALDWAAQNRLTQPVTGQVCHYSNQSDGTALIHVLTCTAPGDVYLQHVDPIRSIDAETEPCGWTWLQPWMNSVREIEQKFNVLQASEVFDGDQVLCRKAFSLLCSHLARFIAHWSLSTGCSPKSKESNEDAAEGNSQDELEGQEEPPLEMPVTLRYPFEDPDTQPIDPRGADYLRAFRQHAPLSSQASEQSPSRAVADLQLDDSFSRDFGVDLISSTPFQRPVAAGSCFTAAAPPPKSDRFDWDFLDSGT